MARNWEEFDQFKNIDRYLPARGEGETMATQIATAVSKLVYKWYNDGDVFDNTGCLSGWANDLSSYANWLARYVPETTKLLRTVFQAYDDGEYEEILFALCEITDKEEFLNEMNKAEKQGSVYKCDGPFRFIEEEEEEDDEYWEDEYEEEECFDDDEEEW